MLFCEAAGILGWVGAIEEVLNQSVGNATSPALRVYAAAEKEGRALSVAELEGLASELEVAIAKEEETRKTFRVGGEQNIAILRNGSVDIAPEWKELKPDTGTALNSIQLSNVSVDCTWSPEGRGFNMSQMPNGPEMSLTLKGCRADLRDNVIYHDSQLIDSYISYSGTGPLRFAVTNKVPGSTLKLAADVDITRADVHSLMCGFPWKALYIGDHEIHPTCK